MGDVPHGSYEKECNEMDNAVSSPCLNVDSAANDIKEGQEFENQTAFRKALRNHAICSKFEYKRTRSGHGVFRARCLKPSCSWSITACKTPDKGTFKIKYLKGNHTCNTSKRSRKHKHVTEKWIADFVTDQKFVHCNPKDIVRAIDQGYGIEVSYHKARRGKILAEKHAGFDQSIAGIETVLKGIERTNPRSTAKLSHSWDKSLRIFVAYKASICGFLHGCRPALALNYMIIDGNGIVWMYAAAADAIDDRFPVASAFVQSNCTENWKWFCEELVRILEGKIPELIFLPNPGEGIVEVVRDSFPDSHHRYLLKQLHEFFTVKLGKEELMVLAFDAAVALNQKEFDAKMVALHNESEAACKVLEGIEPKHWAMSHFEGNYRLMGFNDDRMWKWKYDLHEWSVETEGLDIVPLLKYFHELTVESFNERLENGYCYGERECILERLTGYVGCSCGNRSELSPQICPCVEAIRYEGGNDYLEWYTPPKYGKTYWQKIYPLPDDTI